MTDAFECAELLSHEENLFGRVLIRNGLATKGQVEAAAKDAVDGRAESLEEAVVNRGVMSASTVESVKSAIEKKLQERGLSTASFARPGASGVLDPVKPNQLHETPHDAKDDEERLKRLVKRIVPSRFHMRLLDRVLADGMGVLFADKLSKKARCGRPAHSPRAPGMEGAEGRRDNLGFQVHVLSHQYGAGGHAETDGDVDEPAYPCEGPGLDTPRGIPLVSSGGGTEAERR